MWLWYVVATVRLPFLTCLPCMHGRSCLCNIASCYPSVRICALLRCCYCQGSFPGY